jgi:glycosyltransferase involved in cell wall biosynthesis
MKIVFYSPYFPKHFGGGEKYLLDCIAALLKRGRDEINLALPTEEFLTQEQIAIIRQNYQKFCDYDLSQLKIIATPLGTKASFWQKLCWTKNFDLIYHLTDGSLFFSLAKKNILHIQVPLLLNKRSLVERLKLKNYQIKNSNSFFTKNYVEKQWPVKVDYVHQPLINLKEFPAQSNPLAKKEKIILNVGRFFRQLHSKRQDVLISLFSRLIKQEPKLLEGWQLHLVGSVEDEEYFQEIKSLAKKLPIKIHQQLDRRALVELFQRASLYWQATGYGLDENKHPSAVEHFGIAPIEAMAAYCVPLLIAKGGHKEVLGAEFSDYLWQSDEDCLNKSIALIKNKEERAIVAKQLRIRAEDFNEQRFNQLLFKMIDS